jgi:hypothetical protein
MGALTEWLNELNGAGYDMSFTMFDGDELDKILVPLMPTQAQPEPSDDSFDPETGEVVEFVAHKNGKDKPKAPDGMQLVQIFLDTPSYTRFVECVEALQVLYKTGSLSETIVEAVNRASVSAAVQ